MPIFDKRDASSMTFEMWSNAFDGIHPRFKQTPPKVGSLSIRMTCFPRSAARKAAAYPPGPAPITTISACLDLAID